MGRRKGIKIRKERKRGVGFGASSDASACSLHFQFHHKLLMRQSMLSTFKKESCRQTINIIYNITILIQLNNYNRAGPGFERA